ncbi:IucA/IucC family protein [Pistricoccus aurantiacus]|uniref:IucA/IucC family protein n=1 Tax=Pistricoccus aurantiacus TaxID=1883414 RepID=UPI003633D5F8
MTLSERATASCFFNALLREWPRYEVAPGYLLIRDGEHTLHLPYRHLSIAGRHRFTGPLRLDDRDVSFLEALDWLLRHPELVKLSTPQRAEALKARVQDSLTNLEHSLNAQADLDSLFGEPLDFIEAEAALLVGHSIHPCPKTRGGFTPEDTRRYAPEYANSFPLCWYRVARHRLGSSSGAALDPETLIEQLLPDNPWQEHIDDEHLILPCHPYQHRHWQTDPALATLRDKDELVYLGKADPQWRATSSVRAIWHPERPWMLKFSLSVRLTNSLRHLQEGEFHRGAVLEQVLDSPALAEFATRFPYFRILREPLGLGIQDDAGQLLPQTLMLWRDNPFVGEAAHSVETLATLLQDDPRSGLSRLAQRLMRTPHPETAASYWFAAFLDVVVEPLLIAQADYGLLFGAHQQNILLQLDNLMPVRGWFRDCQGTGFTDLATQCYGPHLGRLVERSANLVPTEMGTRLFGYYLFINATFNVIASLAGAGLGRERDYLARLRDFLLDLKTRGLHDAVVLNYLLESPTLWAKGNFLCAFQAINENTMADPLSLYHPMANPIVNPNANP